jgi:hypothetical protein
MSITARTDPAVRLEADRVVFHNFIETDRQVLEVLATSPDPEALATSCWR